MQKSNIVKINEHDEINKFSNKNHVRFYNSKKKKIDLYKTKSKNSHIEIQRFDLICNMRKCNAFVLRKLQYLFSINVFIKLKREQNQ